MAGTNLRGILTRLIGPSEDAQKAIESLGLSLAEVNPERVGIITAFERLAEAGFSSGEALAIFGQRNISAALAIANTTDKLDELTESNRESAGIAQRNADLIDDTLGGAFKALRSATEEAFLAVGDAGFTGVLRNMVDTLTDAVRSLGEFISSIDFTSTGFKLLTIAAQAAAAAFLLLQATKLPTLFAILTDKIKGTVAALRALQALIARNPFVLLAAGVITVGAALLDLQLTAAETTESLTELNQEAERTQRTFADLSDAQAEFERAEILGDSVDQARAATRQIQAVEGALAELLLAAEKGKLEETIRIEDVERLLPARDIEALAVQVGGEAGVRFGQFFERASEEGLTELESLRRLIQIADETGQEAGEVFTDVFLSEFELIEAPSEEVITALRLRLEDLRSTLQELNVTDEQLARTKEQEAAVRKATESVDLFIQSLQAEREIIAADADEQERITAVRRAEQIVRKAGIELSAEQVQRIRDEVTANQELKREIEDRAEAERRAQQAREDFAEFVGDLEREVELLQLTNDEREVALALETATNLAKETGTALTQEQAEAIRALVAEQQRLRDIDPETGRSRTEDEAEAERERQQRRLEDLAIQLQAERDLREGSFLAELERERQRAEERAALAQEAFEEEVISIEERDALLLQITENREANLDAITEDHAARRRAIRLAEAQAAINIVGTSLATVEQLSEAFGQTGLAQSKAFGVAQAVVSTAIGIARALELGFPAAIPAIAFAAATGAAQIAAINRASKGSGGGNATPRGPSSATGGSAGGGGGGAGGATSESRRDRLEVAFNVRGLEGEGILTNNQARAMVVALEDAVNDGAGGQLTTVQV